MNNTKSPHAEATFREAGVDELITDVLRVGPAPNRSREVFVTVVNVALAGAAIGLLQPEPAVVAALVGIIAAVTVIRWVLGVRKWSKQ